MAFSCIAVLQNSWVEGFFFDGYLYSALGKHAAEKGHWLVPSLSETHYLLFNHHPPFVFIMMGIFFKVFGVSFTTARIFGGAWTVGTILIFTFFVLKTFKNKKNNLDLAFFTGFSFLLNLDLIKKSRFPGLDAPLMFFFTCAAFLFFKGFCSYKAKQSPLPYWSLFGFFLGLIFLTKGPPVIFLVCGILFFLVIKTRGKFFLKNYSLMTSSLIFLLTLGVWPLLLFLNESFFIFEQYINFQIIGSIFKGRGILEVDYFGYLKLLFTKSTLPVALSIFGFYKFLTRKDREEGFDNFYWLCCSWLFCTLLPLSLMSHKYSHYLFPLYPPLSFLSAYGLYSLSTTLRDHIKKALVVLFFIASLLFIIFPLGTESRRSKDLINFKKMTELKGIEVGKNWNVEKDSIARSDVMNFAAFVYSANMHFAEGERLKKDIGLAKKGSVVILKNNTFLDHRENNLELVYNGKLCNCKFFTKL